MSSLATGLHRTGAIAMAVATASAALLAGIAAPAAGAQQTRAKQEAGPPPAVVTGKIVGPDKKAIEEAEVQLGEIEKTVTDRKGYFEFDPTPNGVHDIMVRKIGYNPVRFRITVAAGDIWDGTITLQRAAQALPEVVVLDSAKALRNCRPGWIDDFVARRHVGIGIFFDRVDIENANDVTTVQLMQRVPGITTRSMYGLDEVHVSRCDGPFGMSNKGVVWLNGIRAESSTNGRFIVLNDVRPNQLAGIEIYRGINEIPGQYYEPSACFVVLLWLRQH